jgi:hypothetical protein
LNEYGVNDDRQTGITTADSILPEPSALEMGVEKIIRYNSPGIDQIPA